jgi:hypothetical protein
VRRPCGRRVALPRELGAEVEYAMLMEVRAADERAVVAREEAAQEVERDVEAEHGAER